MRCIRKTAEKCRLQDEATRYGHTNLAIYWDWQFPSFTRSCPIAWVDTAYIECPFFATNCTENSWCRSDWTYRWEINFKRIPLKRTLRTQKKRMQMSAYLKFYSRPQLEEASFTFPKGFHVVDSVFEIWIVQIVFPTIQLRCPVPNRSQLSVIALMPNDNWFPLHRKTRHSVTPEQLSTTQKRIVSSGEEWNGKQSTCPIISLIYLFLPFFHINMYLCNSKYIIYSDKLINERVITFYRQINTKAVTDLYFLLYKKIGETI